MINFNEIYKKLRMLDHIPTKLLGESFKMIDRNFGTDLADKQWKYEKSDMDGKFYHFTFFTIPNGQIYIIFIDGTGFIKFNLIKSIKDFDNFEWENWFEFTKFVRNPDSGGLNIILGLILSIVKRSIGKLGRKQFYFQGADDRLQSSYEFFATNIKVRNTMSDLGVVTTVEKDSSTGRNLILVNFQ